MKKLVKFLKWAAAILLGMSILFFVIAVGAQYVYHQWEVANPNHNEVGKRLPD